MNTNCCAISTAWLFLAMGLPARCVEPAHDYPIRPVPAQRVRFDDAFWHPRIATNRNATIPFSFQMCEETGRIENFKVAGGLSTKKWTGLFGFNDSDVYKVMEGAAYSLMTHTDEKLGAYLEELVGYIAAAQEDDGYLYTRWTARDRIANPKEIRCCVPGDRRWVAGRESHELYNLGHLYEAAVAHRDATGNTRFLDVAKKSADRLIETFGPGKFEMPSGHPEIELGLVKLYRATGDERYLELTRFLLDVRGRPTDDRPNLWGEYNQDHKPLRQQDEAVGHAVRAIYLYAGATDVAALTDDRELAAVMDRLWSDVVGTKTYVTGGIGATAEGEAFGKRYYLPNESAYSETCANLATCLWNQRMFLLHGDAKYIDMLERALYNSTISGVSLDGNSFFYPNPLSANGNFARSKWFDCACCPTNLCRFVPSVPGFAYATHGDSVYVNLFIAGSTELELGGGTVRIEQRTDYPWTGRVTIDVTPRMAGQRITLRVRIPGWAQGEAFSSDLYRYLDTDQGAPSLAVNGVAASLDVVAGYAVVERQWQPGDSITLELPMPVRRVVAHENVAADRGRVALMRGPLVYCVEGPDVPGGRVHNLVLPDDAALVTESRQNLLGGLQVVTGTSQRVVPAANGSQAPSTTAVSFTAIPYYAWAHRGPSEMAVWLPRSTEVLNPTKDPAR